MKKAYKKIFKNTKQKLHLLIGLSLLLLLAIGITTYLITYGDLILDFNTDSDYLTSQIKDNKVIINEIESDYYYYKSLNYTNNTGTLTTN